MFSWLGSLPLIWQISIPVGVLLTLIILAVWGKVSFSWGKAKIGFGAKSSCSKCIALVRSIGKKVDRKVAKVEANNLKSKMNFAEQQLLSVHMDMYGRFLGAMRKKNKDNPANDILEDKELICCRSKLKVVFSLMKDELRRAFKENGFDSLSDNEFNDYIKDESNILVDIFEQFIISNYPRHMIISYRDITDIVLKMRPVIDKSVESIFKKARAIEVITIEEITKLEEQYEKDVGKIDANTLS